MDAVQILILVSAAYCTLMLWRLVTAVRRNWDGEIEDLLDQDVIIRRLATTGVSLAAFLAVILLRGPIRGLLTILQG